MITSLSVRDAEGAGDGGLRVRIRARLAYDGTDFSGWARQPDRRTVQGEVERALTVALHHPVPVQVVCAGRTDAGVHARDQHIHADLRAEVWNPADTHRLVRRINGLLPDDVRMRDLASAPAGFDARFSVLSRRYCYRLTDGTEVDPLQRRFVVTWPHVLDLDAMNTAARAVLGEHDFAAFCRRRPEASSVRTLRHLRWQRDAHGVVAMSIEADAFCHSMVRSLVGAFLPVGSGRRPPEWPAAVLAGGKRIPEVVVMPAHGLVLERVSYADDPAAQAAVARRVRGPIPSGVG